MAYRIASGWALFAGTHIGMTEPAVKDRLVGLLGEQGYLATYSVVALATLGGVSAVYYRAFGTGVQLLSTSKTRDAFATGLKYTAVAMLSQASS